VGQTVRVLVRAYPERAFPGRILRLGEELDPTTRTLKVRVLVPNQGGLLKPEMYATAEIERAGSRSALFVPEAAAQDLNGNRVVFVKTGADRFEARPIQVARVSDGKMEVTNGLKAGDQVAVKGSFILKSQLLRSSMESE
jgi:cobalt-zinc-cadmium efflux system membrane fusion protein